MNQPIRSLLLSLLFLAGLVGAQAAFLSAGGYYHHIGLNTWESRGGTPPAPGTTGLYHAAILYPTRAAQSPLGL